MTHLVSASPTPKISVVLSMFSHALQTLEDGFILIYRFFFPSRGSDLLRTSSLIKLNNKQKTHLELSVVYMGNDLDFISALTAR